MNKPAELSYYGLYLLSHLKENHPDKAGDAAFIEVRADHAADVYERARLDGYLPEGAHELAMAALLEGLHFSKYNTVIEVLWNECADEVPVTRNFAASLFRNIKYFTLRKLYLCRKWMQKRLQKTTTTGITLPNFDFLA